jgi:hypothetical protein
MRTIKVSIEVFAAIWKARLPGENSEATILARLLGTTASNNPSRRKVKGAISDESESKVDWSNVEV